MRDLADRGCTVMADIVSARVVGDWRRIVGDFVSGPAGGGFGDGINGLVILTPDVGVPGSDVLFGDGGIGWSVHRLRCFVLHGLLHDADLANPWQDVAVSVDGHPVRWVASFNLSYRHMPGDRPYRLSLPDVVFGPGDVSSGGRVSLTVPSS